jgi:hypothetical protein
MTKNGSWLTVRMPKPTARSPELPARLLDSVITMEINSSDHQVRYQPKSFGSNGIFCIVDENGRAFLTSGVQKDGSKMGYAEIAAALGVEGYDISANGNVPLSSTGDDLGFAVQDALRTLRPTSDQREQLRTRVHRVWADHKYGERTWPILAWPDYD